MKMTGTLEGIATFAALAACALACGSSSGGSGAGEDGGARDGATVAADAGGDGGGTNAEAGQEAGGDGAPATGDSGVCPSSELSCGGICVPNDSVNCGSCNNDCTTLHVTTTPSCVAGKCSFPALTCAAGWAHCSSDPSTGCESDLSQGAHCGSCTNACGTAICSGSGNSYTCLHAVALAAASNATFAVFSDGTIKSWGSNSGETLDTNGVLGTGTSSSSGTPALVTGITTATAVAGGDDHACALLSGGTVSCWGDNTYGQLGLSADPTTGTSAVTTPVAVPDLSNVTAIAAGLTHTCAIISGGTVECWGSNDYNELGNGTSTSCNGGYDTCSPTPSPVTGLSGVTAIAIGADNGYADHTCAVLSNGTVKCWGYNADGELGNGTDDLVKPFSSGTPVLVSGVTTATGITAFAEGACARLSGGTVMCWGNNSLGALGNGSTTDSATPVPVSGLDDAASLSIGSASFTVCAARTGGSAVCWGNGANGELGGGVANDQSDAPVAVVSLTNVTAIAAGGNHLCALLATGNVECWGNNGFDGEIGNTSADLNDNYTPLPVQW
jgi:alpha-tubulin suppressor-like RCC1 family protein